MVLQRWRRRAGAAARGLHTATLWPCCSMARMLNPAIALAWLAVAGAVEPPIDAWMDAVVLLEQGSTTCAGVVIDAEGTVATAYHCVAAGGRPRARRRDGTAGVGRVTGTDRRRDLALVAVPALAGGGWLPLSTRDPALGAPIWVLGHPSGGDVASGFYSGTLRFSAVNGIVSAVGSESLQISAPVNPGNSGGPVVDGRGQVVGIVSRRLGGQALGFAGRSEHLAPLMAQERRLGVGGTVALEGAFVAMDRGAVALSPRVEFALRDRLVVEGSVSFPVSPRWSAARFGESVVLRGEAHGGLRQRVGRGPWASRLDVWAGVAQRERLSAAADDPLSWTTEVDFVPVVGGVVRVRSVGFEVAFGLGEPVGRAAVVLRVPGVFSVF